jgi:hypothetical protein
MNLGQFSGTAANGPGTIAAVSGEMAWRSKVTKLNG